MARGALRFKGAGALIARARGALSSWLKFRADADNPPQVIRPEGWDSFAPGRHGRGIRPEGWDASSFGNFIRGIFCTGWNELRVRGGTVTTRNAISGAGGIPAPGDTAAHSVLNENTQFIHTHAEDGMGAGEPEVVNRNQEIHPGGIYPPLIDYEDMTVQHQTRVYPAGFSHTAVGAHWLSHEVRSLLVAGRDLGALGTPWVSHSPRVIDCSGEGIRPPIMDRPPLISNTQEIHPYGWDSQAFGTRIGHVTQRIQPTSIPAPRFGTLGEHIVRSTAQVVHPAPIMLTNLFGPNTEVYNLTQYVRQIADPADGMNPPDQRPGYTGSATEVRNLARVVGPSGYFRERFGYHTLRNTGQVVTVAGFDPFETGTAFVAHHTRDVAPTGIAPVSAAWHIVYNAAQAIAPQGIPPTLAFGFPKVFDPAQKIAPRGIGAQAVGEAFVAYRVREVKFGQTHQEMRPPYPGMPTVYNGQNFIRPEGINPPWLGLGHYLETRLTQMKVYSIGETDAYGTPTVRNVTPEVRVFGRDAVAFGHATVYNHDSYIDLNGHGIDGFDLPMPRVSDSRQWVSPAAASGGHKFGPHTRVENAWEWAKDIPQTVGPYGWDSLSPADRDNTRVGRQNEVLPTGIRPGETMGTPTVINGSIRVAAFSDGAVGTPTVITVATQYIRPIGMRPTDGYGEHLDISPQRIWCTDTKVQYPVHYTAYWAHIGQWDWWLWDGGVENPPWFESSMRFGEPTIVTKPPPVRAYGIAPPKDESAHWVGNRTQIIYPTGARLDRHGTAHHIASSIQTINLDGFTDEFDADQPGYGFGVGEGAGIVLGEPFVKNLYDPNADVPGSPKTLNVHGADMQAFGTHLVEGSIRSIYPAGFDAAALGASLPAQFETPSRWQSLHVGYPDWPETQGHDSMVFGAHWVSHGVREIVPEGFDTFLSEYDRWAFSARMVVKRGTASAPPSQGAQTIRPSAVPAPVVPAPQVIGAPRPIAQYIHPDGNADCFRKGAPRVYLGPPP
jgi:hypothetical protein